MPPEILWVQEVIFPLVAMGIGVLVLVGGYRVTNRWLDRRHERQLAASGGGVASPVLREQLEQLRARLDAVEDVGPRIQEVEERLDFAERLLTQQRERGQVGPGA